MLIQLKKSIFGIKYALNENFELQGLYGRI